MRHVFVFLVGVILTILSLTLFGASTYLGVALLYCLVLYWLFFANNHRDAQILLISSAISLELLSPGRFGMASLMALVIWTIYHLFALQLRFTSLHARYIVALLILLAIYGAFVSPANLIHHWLALTVLSIPVSIAALYFSISKETPQYELL